MKDETKKKLRSLIIPFIAAAVILLLAVLGIYRCPFRAVTGFPCPLCGTTRAFMSLLRLDIPLSFHYHPMWPVTFLTVIYIILTGTGIIRCPKPWREIIPIVAGCLLIGCYIWRIATHTLVY